MVSCDPDTSYFEAFDWRIVLAGHGPGRKEVL